MKRMLLALLLMSSSAYAQAYGVIVSPIPIGPLAAPVYREFLDELLASGAIPCQDTAQCTRIIVSIITGKRGRSRYIVGVSTTFTPSGASDTHIVHHSSSLRRNKGAWFTPEEWGIDRLAEETE